jgi:hypothetical protein
MAMIWALRASVSIWWILASSADLRSDKICQFGTGHFWSAKIAQVDEIQLLPSGGILLHQQWQLTICWCGNILVADFVTFGIFKFPEPVLLTKQGVEMPNHPGQRAPFGGKGAEIGLILPGQALHLHLGLQVGESVGSTESVNGLFGIADEDEGVVVSDPEII